MDPEYEKYLFRKNDLKSATQEYECVGKINNVTQVRPRTENTKDPNCHPQYLLDISKTEIPPKQHLTNKEVSLVSEHNFKLKSLLRYGIYPKNKHFCQGLCDAYLKY